MIANAASLVVAVVDSSQSKSTIIAVHYLPRLCLFALALVSGIASSPLLAQTANATHPWRDALQWLDSDSAADWTAAEDMLRQADTTGDSTPEALCTLALFRLRQQDPQAAMQIVAELAKQRTAEQLEATRSLMLRIQLAAALLSQQDALAEQAFKDLVRRVVAASGDPAQHPLNAYCLGTVIGMLSTPTAKSPISKRDLEIGRQCLLDSMIPKVTAAFTEAEASAYEQTQELERQLTLIAKHGLAAQTAVYEAQAIQLRAAQAQLAEQKDRTSETLRNAKESLAQNTRDRRKLEQQIQQLQFQLRQPTPGHPGPKRAAPADPPSRSSIMVDEYELRTETESIIQDGKTVRVQVTRRVRRSPNDINRERDELYRAIMRDYEQTKREYQQYVQTYEQTLKSWTELDRARREKLSREKTEAETQREELIAESQAIQSDKATAAKEMVSRRTEQEQEFFEWTMQGLALQASQTNKVAGLFRPPYYEVLRWSQEKGLLQRDTR